MNYKVLIYDNKYSTDENISKWLPNYEVTELQRENIKYNHNIVGKVLDVNGKYYEYIYKA